MTKHDATVKAMRAILAAIVDAVEAAGPMGAPSGVLYAGLMGIMPIQTYEAIIDTLCGRGLLRKEGDLLFRQ